MGQCFWQSKEEFSFLVSPFFYVLAKRNVTMKTENMTNIAMKGKAETSLMSASTYNVGPTCLDSLTLM